MSRDFTVNAMGYDVLVAEKLLDPCGGVQDLLDSRLRVCSKSSIMDDPVRTIRAVRLASQLEFQITPDTVKLVREGIPGLVGVSPERKRDELFEILKDPRPDRALQLLDHLGITQIAFSSPGAEGDLEPRPMALNSLHVVGAAVDLTTILVDNKNPDAVANATLGLAITQLGRFRQSITSYLNRYMGYDHRIIQLFYFAVLLAALPGEIRSSSPLSEREIAIHIQHVKNAERISRTLHLSNIEVEWIRKCLRSQIEFGEGRRAPSDTPSNMFRYYRKAGEAGIAGILLYLARVVGAEASPPDQGSWAAQLDTAVSFFSAYFETPHDSISPEPFLKGDEMMTLLGIESGPEIGSLLELMLEAQVSKEVNSKEEAIAFVKENLRSMQAK
jgi:tRNA nucleotidyltransferase/poly(A) polymerase